MNKKKEKIKHLAVIDIGSNSIKMSMARLNHKTKTVLEDKLPLRLLENDQRKISTKNINKLDRALRRFFLETKPYHPQFKVFATSAMRRAENKKTVIKNIRKKWGVKIQVISGIQEAKYVLHAVEEKFHLERGYFCIVDIGGGSMEIIQLYNGKVLWMKSIPFGSVVVKENFCSENISDVFDVGMIVGKIENDILKKIPTAMRGGLIISGGTPSSIARIFQVKKKIKNMHGKLISKKELFSILEPLLQNPKLFWSTKYKIHPSRRDLLLPCLATIMALLRIGKMDGFQMSRTGLRQGVVAEAFKRS